MENKLYKGQIIDTGKEKWVTGSYYYAELSKQHFLIEEVYKGIHEFHHVFPDTITEVIE